ncbi:ankyrin repeat domain-containing protein [uncultured Roseobacter sp.]|uniref:ankyrin repeat domain-containing protein n=1 Tax=uncultured Roseobacter sp. TaxID=114847 RepID=UPI00260280F0|nr:ankyrin repeat domain-containing protein [uncultured Roseobacter sp.]
MIENQRALGSKFFQFWWLLVILLTTPAYAIEPVASYRMSQLVSVLTLSDLAPKFHPDGRSIAVSTESSILLLDPLTGATLDEINSSDSIWKFDFSPNGDYLAIESYGSENLLTLRDLRKNAEARQETTVLGNSLTFGPLSRRIVADDFLSGDFQILSVRHGRPSKHRLSSYDKIIDTFFSLDGRYIGLEIGELKGKFDRKHASRVEIFDVANNSIVKKYDLPDDTQFIHFDQRNGAFFRSFKPYRLAFLSWSGDPELEFIKFHARDDIRLTPAFVRLCPDGKSYFTLSRYTSDITFANVLNQSVETVNLRHDNLAKIEAAAISTDGRRLVTFREDSSNQVWMDVWALPDCGALPVEVDAEQMEQLSKIKDAIASGDDVNLKSLISRDLVNSPYSDPPLLHLAVLHGGPASVAILLDAGADVNATEPGTGWSALMSATQANNELAVATLLKAGAKSDVVGSLGSTFAALFLHSTIGTREDSSLFGLRDILSKQFPADQLDRMLYLAAARGSPSLVSTLLTLGADPNSLHEGNTTALMNAALSTRPEQEQIVRDLLLFGDAATHRRSDGGGTALEFALASKGSINVINSILAAGFASISNDQLSEIATAVGNTRAANGLRSAKWRVPKITVPAVAEIELSVAHDMNSADVRRVQRELASLGLYKSSIDGVWGPATRRGLASYFKVTFDAYRSAMDDFCSDVRRDMKTRGERDSAGDGSGWSGNWFWKYDGRRAIVRNRDDNFRLSCEFPIGIAATDKPESASITTKGYTALLHFESECDEDKWWHRSSLRKDRHFAVIDFGCVKSIAGAPVLSGDTYTSWYEY